MLREFHGRIAQTVFEFDGTLDKFLGDGVMVTFGTPDTRADDAVRALDCARAIIHTISDWNAVRTARGEPTIKVGVGLHFGSVVLGDVGDENRLEIRGDWRYRKRCQSCRGTDADPRRGHRGQRRYDHRRRGRWRECSDAARIRGRRSSIHPRPRRAGSRTDMARRLTRMQRGWRRRRQRLYNPLRGPAPGSEPRLYASCPCRHPRQLRPKALQPTC